VHLSGHARSKLTASFIGDTCKVMGMVVEKRGEGMHVKGIGFQQTWQVCVCVCVYRGCVSVCIGVYGCVWVCMGL
jgi:hypothetical protein